MAKISSFVKTLPEATCLYNFILECCRRRIPFHYDPAAKLFSAFPVCQEDLDVLLDYYRYLSNRDLNPFAKCRV